LQQLKVVIEKSYGTYILYVAKQIRPATFTLENYDYDRGLRYGCN